MTSTSHAVPEDPNEPGRDVLGSKFADRGHFIHEVMARAADLSLDEISSRAEQLARQSGANYNERTFSPAVTGNHLRQFLRDKKQYAEQLPDKRWRLTERARQRIARTGERAEPGYLNASIVADDLRTVDDKGRIVLPRAFANATVTVTEVSDTELRIQKAVVVPEAALPLMEDALQPLSDRDRDLFLDLIENPPEPNAAFRKAAEAYKKRHG